jgi:2-methylisocitrate lyase-like PEP mutase family enzyme
MATVKEKTTTKLRRQLSEKGIIVEASCYNPLTAKLAERLGFRQIWVAGWGTGAQYCYTEPLTTMTEYVYFAKMIADAVSIPVIVDASTGFGDPIYVMRAVREFEKAGIAGMTLEDQVYPKRVQYHARPQVKYVIPAEEMVVKLKAALRAKTDDDFVIVARSDADGAVGGSLEEMIRRLKMYEDAGADMLRAGVSKGGALSDIETLKKIRAATHVPLEASLSKDIKPGVRGPITPKVLEELGYKVARTTMMSIALEYKAAKELFMNVLNNRPIGITEEEFSQVTWDILETIGIPKLIEEELKTTKPPYTGNLPC